MAEESLRTLCMAYKPVRRESLEIKDDRGIFEIEKSGFILLAVLGVKDVPRPEVPSAI
jgi:Ca2+ transporting ATPase